MQTPAPTFINPAQPPALNSNQQQSLGRISHQMQTTANVLNENCTPGSVQYLNAIDALRIAAMWANLSVTQPTPIAAASGIGAGG